MFLVTIYRILKTSAVSLWRNRWLALAATLIMVLTLFTISFFLSLIVMIDKTSTLLKDKVDITVYFNESTSKDQIFAVENALLSRSDVKLVDYISKEQALAKWQDDNRNNPKLRDIISTDFNPLPRSLEIKTNQAEDLTAVNDFLSSSDYQPLIKEISYQKNKNLIDRLVKITTFTKIVGWILSAVFVLVSVLIIYNTIRLTIYARKEEIDIMKLVGASDWYVQGPFIAEGIIYGVIGALISATILFLTYHFSLPAAANYLGISADTFSGLSLWLVLSIQLLIGVALGVVCSLFAVKNHLKK